MNWIDQIWHSGYCDETVKFSSTTEQGAAGSQARIDWLDKHSPDCEDCRNAMFFKEMEGKIAKELGFHAEFLQGHDVTKHPKFQQKMGTHLAMAMLAGRINDDVVAWMERMAGRHSAPWPGNRP
jgi:hypothetical protein